MYYYYFIFYFWQQFSHCIEISMRTWYWQVVSVDLILTITQKHWDKTSLQTFPLMIFLSPFLNLFHYWPISLYTSVLLSDWHDGQWWIKNLTMSYTDYCRSQTTEGIKAVVHLVLTVKYTQKQQSVSVVFQQLLLVTLCSFVMGLCKMGFICFGREPSVLFLSTYICHYLLLYHGEIALHWPTSMAG